jgi:hypothetical protein
MSGAGIVMSKLPPDLSRNSASRDTLVVSVDVLKRARQLPLGAPAKVASKEALATGAPTGASPPSLPPSWMEVATRNRERPGPPRAVYAVAGALILAVPFLVSSTRQSHVASAAPPPAPAGLTAKAAALSPAAAPPEAPASQESEHADVSCSEATALVPNQLIELDSVRVNRVLAPARQRPLAAPASKKRFFDPAAAEFAVRGVSSQLTECGADTKGKVNVAVTFAPSGVATVATVQEERLRGTPTGSCVAQHLRGARILGFDGERETITTTLMVD